MTFHTLAEDSGSTPERRREEATDLVNKISTSGNCDQLSAKETEFIEQIEDDTTVSTKQLFWLREIWNKVM